MKLERLLFFMRMIDFRMKCLEITAYGKTPVK